MLDGQNEFATISDFIKVGSVCFFCDKPLRVRLTSFIEGIPRLNAPLENNEFSFKLQRVTQDYTLEATGLSDIKTNALVFILDNETVTPSLDQRVVKESFEDLLPTIELYCSNSKCKHKYHICSTPLKCNYLGSKVDSWIVKPLKIWYEGFVERSHVVHNDYLIGDTLIYSRNNEDATPITTSMLDWQAMGKEKLLTRIRTLVTFT